MKILQIRPVNYDQVEVVGRTKHNSTISKEVLIINSMLNPETDSPKTLINILEKFFFLEYEFNPTLEQKITLSLFFLKYVPSNF